MIAEVKIVHSIIAKQLKLLYPYCAYILWCLNTDGYFVLYAYGIYPVRIWAFFLFHTSRTYIGPRTCMGPYNCILRCLVLSHCCLFIRMLKWRSHPCSLWTRCLDLWSFSSWRYHKEYTPLMIAYWLDS